MASTVAEDLAHGQAQQESELSMLERSFSPSKNEACPNSDACER